MKSIIKTLVFVLLTFIGFSQEDSVYVEKNLTTIRVQQKHRSIDSSSTQLLQLTDNYLESQAEITMMSRGNFAKEPTIRGLNAGQVNLTIDGIQMFGACTDRMDPISSYIEPSNLSSIDINTGVNRNAASSSIGGGINFKLNRATPGNKRFISGYAGIGYESNGNNLKGLASLQLSKEKWAILFNSIYRQSDNYNSGGRQEVRYSQYQKWNGTINFTQKLKQFSELNISYLQDEGYNIGYPALTMDVAFAKAKIGAVEYKYHNTNKRFYHAKTKLYINYIDHAMDDTKRDPEEIAMHMDMPGTSRTIGGYSEASFRLHNKHFVSARLTSYTNDLHAEMTMYPPNGNEMFMLTIPDARRIQNGVQLSDRILFNEKINLTVSTILEHQQSTITTAIGRKTLTSLQVEKPERSTFIYNLSAQVLYKINKKNSIGFNLQRGMRNASLKELYGFYLFDRMDNYDYIGNVDLKTESSLNAQIDFTKRLKKVDINIRSFIYYFENYIAGVTQADFSAMTIGASGVKQFQNIGDAYILGGELTANYSILESLRLNSTNAISYGKDMSGHYLPYIPPFKSSNKLTYQYKKVNFVLEVVGSTGQQKVSTERYGEFASKGFVIANASINKTFELKNIKLSCSIDGKNLTDEQYYEHLDIMKVNRPGRSVGINILLLF